MSSNINQDELRKLAEAWEPTFDDRVEPLLLAFASKREAARWTYEDAVKAIAFLLSDNVPTILSQADEIARLTTSEAALREALQGLVEAFGSDEAGEVGRRLAMIDARAALSPPHADREVQND